jgi:hypothetical protein
MAHGAWRMAHQTTSNAMHAFWPCMRDADVLTERANCYINSSCYLQV